MLAFARPPIAPASSTILRQLPRAARRRSRTRAGSTVTGLRAVAQQVARPRPSCSRPAARRRSAPRAAPCAARAPCRTRTARPRPRRGRPRPRPRRTAPRRSRRSASSVASRQFCPFPRGDLVDVLVDQALVRRLVERLRRRPGRRARRRSRRPAPRSSCEDPVALGADLLLGARRRWPATPARPWPGCRTRSWSAVLRASSMMRLASLARAGELLAVVGELRRRPPVGSARPSPSRPGSSRGAPRASCSRAGAPTST